MNQRIAVESWLEDQMEDGNHVNVNKLALTLLAFIGSDELSDAVDVLLDDDGIDVMETGTVTIAQDRRRACV
jgi:hypothetical protein